MERRLSIDWNVVTVLQNYVLRNLALSPGPYLTLGFGWLSTLLLLRSTLEGIRTGYLMVISEPFLFPLIAMCLLGGLFAALTAGLSVARERELGTLETLFCGPVSHLDYFLGKQSGHLIAYTVMLTFFLVGCLVFSILTGLALSPLLLAIAVLSIATAGGFVGLGLLTAAAMRTIRSAFLLFLTLILVPLALQVGHALLTGIVSRQNFVELVVLRDTVGAVKRVLVWSSPAWYLMGGADALMRQHWPEWIGYVTESVLYGLAALGLSTAMLRWKGVTR